MARRAPPDGALLALLGGAALVLRLAYLIDYDEDIDALRFALGVERFDVAALRPHAPFYPVLIGFAKVVHFVGASPHAALGIVNALSGAAVVVATALIAFEIAGRRAAYAAGALALASPLLWLSSQKLTSDIAGTAFVAAALWCCARARRTDALGDAPRAFLLRTIALVGLGIGLGVRLSIFPVAVACLVSVARAEGGGRAWGRRFADLAAGIVIWLVPLIVVAGPKPLVAVTWTQGLGHFTRWGGTIVTVASPTERASGWIWGLWANALGGAWPDAPKARWLAAPLLIALAAAFVLPVVRSRGALLAALRRQPELAAACAAYFAWAALGQNTAYKPRHWLPLVPPMIAALAAGSERLALRTRAAALVPAGVALSWFVDAEALVRAHLEPSPAASIVQYLRDHDDGRVVASAEVTRMINVGAPARRVLPVSSTAAIVGALETNNEQSLLITSEALSPEVVKALRADGHSLRIVHARPRSRYVDSLWNELALTEAGPQPPRRQGRREDE